MEGKEWRVCTWCIFILKSFCITTNSAETQACNMNTLITVFSSLFCHQARYGSLKIKGKKRPALNSVNYGLWKDYCWRTLTNTHTHIHTQQSSLLIGGLYCQPIFQLFSVWRFTLLNSFISLMMNFLLTYLLHDSSKTSDSQNTWCFYLGWWRTLCFLHGLVCVFHLLFIIV